MVESRKRKSLLGILALLGGVASLLFTRFHVLGVQTVTIHSVTLPLGMALGVGAAAVALIGLAGAAASPRTGTGLPIVALVISTAALVLAFKPNLWTAGPGFSPAQPAARPPAHAPTPAHASTNPSRANTSARAKTMFDDDFPSSAPHPAGHSDGSKPSAPRAPASPTIAAPSPASRAAAIQAAREKLESAKANVMRSLEATDDYQQAKSAADAADMNLKEARQMYPPGSYNLLQADRAAIEAHQTVQKLINDTTAKDPTYQAAQRDLNTAQSAGTPAGTR